MKYSLSICWLLLCIAPVASLLGADKTTTAVWITNDGAQNLRVEYVPFPPSTDFQKQSGVLLWNEQDRDHWQTFPAPLMTAPLGSPADLLPALAGVSRGDSTNDRQTVALLDVHLDQLVGGELFRDVPAGALFTPANNQALLNGQLTLRRQPMTQGVPYPEIEFVLQDRNSSKTSILFPAGKQRLAWKEIDDLPEAWQTGLPPGDYLLRSAQKNPVIRFSIAPTAQRESTLKVADALAVLLGSQTDPIYLQVAVESLLGGGAEVGEGYLVDAFDLLDAVPAKQLSAHLSNVHQQLKSMLQGQSSDPQAAEDPTGVLAIDVARRQIRLGRWEAAQATLSQSPDDSDRGRGLAALYEAVIQAESGVATAGNAHDAFQAAIELLQSAPPADQFRAHNNYASFLLSQSQDAIYNSASQIASSVPHPIFTGLELWIFARDELDEGARLAKLLGPSQQATILVSQSRLYALLADYLEVIRAAEADDGLWKNYGEIAGKEAVDRATQVTTSQNAEATDNDILAVAYEMLARLAHRRRDAAACQQAGHEAMRKHLENGSLTGLETAHRLVALSLLRDSEAKHEPSDDAAAKRKDALRHFTISQTLSEFLRQRIPADQFGLSRAGFFSRRAYVNDCMVDLLASDGKSDEALFYAEAAKARALQDFLASHGTSAQDRITAPQTVAEIISAWPAGLVAFEYFMSVDRIHLFVVDETGVATYVLKDEQGEPLSPVRCIAETQRLTGNLDHAAKKLSSAIVSGKAADSAWQDQLEWFYQRLIPPEAAARLSTEKTLLIVPHHVLHYLPFAALVSKKDERELAYYQIPQPTYLLENVQSLFYAPSLTTYLRLRLRSDGAFETVSGFGKSDFDGAPSLPGVVSDMKSVRMAFADQVQEIAEGDDTTEEKLKQMLSTPGALLVGTHGQNIASAPLLSYLRCGSTPQSDGLLQAAEIYETPVRKNLILLSACYSGLADQSPMPGDDLFGLQRALLQAGASTVVTGQWDIFDRTGTILMKNFLQKLAAGEPTSLALANAQREFLISERKSNGIYSHPYFWSVLNVTGVDTTAFNQKGITPMANPL